mmetsp:Transcript_11943/g.28991  ORF Transcript_11943/g.28991 Transcript_11943/m.28991 type:complete len:203 (-) Transcript_11943:335-943(-)
MIQIGHDKDRHRLSPLYLVSNDLRVKIPRLAAQLVDDNAGAPIPIVRRHAGLGAHDLGKDSAALNVGHEEPRTVESSDQGQVANVSVLKIQFRAAARAFHENHLCLRDLRQLLVSRQDEFHFVVGSERYGGFVSMAGCFRPVLTAQNDGGTKMGPRTAFSAALEENGVHFDAWQELTRLSLHGLGYANLAIVLLLLLLLLLC